MKKEQNKTTERKTEVQNGGTYFGILKEYI